MKNAWITIDIGIASAGTGILRISEPLMTRLPTDPPVASAKKLKRTIPQISIAAKWGVSVPTLRISVKAT